MIKRYKVYPYMDRNREIKLAKELNEKGEWVKYKDCDDRVKVLSDDNIRLQNEMALLTQQNKLLTEALEWYSDVVHWLPSDASGKNMMTEIEMDQGNRAREALLKIGKMYEDI